MAGHTMGIQAVRVPLNEGTCCWRQTRRITRTLGQNVPFSIWSQPDLMTYDKIEQLADSQDHVIPGHDPIVRDLYRLLGHGR